MYQTNMSGIFSVADVISYRFVVCVIVVRAPLRSLSFPSFLSLFSLLFSLANKMDPAVRYLVPFVTEGFHQIGINPNVPLLDLPNDDPALPYIVTSTALIKSLAILTRILKVGFFM